MPVRRAGASIRRGTPKALFDLPADLRDSRNSYAVDPTGLRFLLNVPVDEPTLPPCPRRCSSTGSRRFVNERHAPGSDGRHSSLGSRPGGS